MAFPLPDAVRRQTLLWIENGFAELDSRAALGLERLPPDHPLIVTTTFRWRDATRQQFAAYHDLRHFYESVKFQDALWNSATNGHDKLTRLDDPVIWGRYCDLLVTLAREQQARGIAQPLILVDLEWLANNQAGLQRFAKFWEHIQRLDTDLPAGTTLLLYPTGPGVVGRDSALVFTPHLVRTFLGLPQVVLLDHDWRQRAWVRGELPEVGTAGSLKADSLAHYYHLTYNRSPWGLCYFMWGCTPPAGKPANYFDWCWDYRQVGEAVQRSAALGAPWTVGYAGLDRFAALAAELYPDYVGAMREIK